MTTTKEQIDRLLARRDELLKKIDGDPRKAEVEKLRTHIVELQQHRRPQGEIDAAKEKRAALQAGLFVDVEQINAQVSALRKQLTREQELERGKAYEKLSDTELRTRRAALMEERKKNKGELRAVSAVLQARAAERRIDELAASLSPAEKERLRQVIFPEGIPGGTVGTPGGQ